MVLFVISISQISFSQDIPVKITPVKPGTEKNGGKQPDRNLAQITVLPGNGSTSGNGRAPQGSRKFINTKYLITGSEMNTSGFGSGTVYSIGWKWNSPTGTSQGVNTIGRLVVYLRDTLASAVTIGGTFIDTTGAGYTKIIEGTISIPASTNEINIDVPVGGPGTSLFTATPGNGVIVEFVYTTYDITGTTLGGPTCFCTNLVAGALATYQSQTVNGSTGAISSFRPETRFSNTVVSNNDVGAFANTSPSGSLNSPPVTTYAPKATVKNFGLLTQGPFDVSCVISGPVNYSNTKSVATLGSGGTAAIVFDSTFTPTVGSYSMKISTLLVGDESPSNDTLTTFFTVANFNYGAGTGSGSTQYYFSNSVTGNGSPSAPTYSWIDPVASGHTAAVFADPDDGTLPVDIGFNFTYMGTTFNTGSTNLNIYVNGFLNLGTAVSGAFYGVTGFPNAGNPANMISPGVIDLHVDQAFYPTARVYYGGDASKFVITYFHAYRWVAANNSTDYLTMQVILTPNGNIKFQFNDAESFNHLTTFAPFCDIGLQDGANTAGLQYRLNGNGGPMFGSPMAIEFGLDPNVLPVELASFTSNTRHNNVELNWATTMENNNSGFDVERKLSSSNSWAKIGNVAGHGTTNTTNSYSYKDNNIASGNYNYRLKQIDFNGNFHYYALTGEVIVSIPTKFSLSQNYPNPFNPSTKINYDLPVDSKVSIKLFDITGKQVSEIVNTLQTAGYHTVQFNASNLSSGTYFYTIEANNFVMTKKMLLVK